MITSMLRRAQLSGGCAATAEPDAPFALSASGVTSSTITLNFDDSTSSPNEATSYEIGISSDGITWTTTTLNVTGSPPVAYQFTGLNSGTTYSFRVRGVNCFGSGFYDGESFTQATAAGSLSPSWTLDFSTGTPSGYTLTRASTGTYVDSSGYVASGAIDFARLTHDKNGSRLGLLVEGAATNLAQYSEDFANAYWTKSNVLPDDNGGSFWTSPANASDAVLLEQVSGTGTHHMRRQFASVTNICVSIFAKKQTTSGVGRYLTILFRSTNDYPHATFDLDAGTVTQSGNVSVTGVWSNNNQGIEDYGNGWYRCWLTATRASGTSDVTIALANTGTPTMTTTGQSYNAANSTDGVYIWGAMYEARNGPPTSYIETPSNANVTRSADLAHVLDSSITSWGDPGALVVHFYPPGQAGTLISTDDASTAQVGIKANSTTTACAFWSSNETSTGTIGTGVQKAVHYWNGSTSKFAINGSTPVSNTNNFTIANADFVTLGAEATDSSGVPGTFSQYANCVIRKVEFYSGTLTDANLQTITT